MELILLDNIEGLGRKGAIVKVKNGFGRNYLLPYKKAMPVNPDNLARLGKLKVKNRGLELSLNPRQLAPEDLKRLALAVLGTDSEGHALAAFFLHRAGDERLARQHLAKSGPLADQVSTALR